MEGSAIDQEVSLLCRVTKSIGDAVKMNHSWLGKIKCTSLGNQEKKHGKQSKANQTCVCMYVCINSVDDLV